MPVHSLPPSMPAEEFPYALSRVGIVMTPEDGNLLEAEEIGRAHV